MCSHPLGGGGCTQGCLQCLCAVRAHVCVAFTCVSRRALVCLVCARTRPCVHACTGLGVHMHIARVCACMGMHWCVCSGAQAHVRVCTSVHAPPCVCQCIPCAHAGLCVSVHTCACLCASLSPCTRVLWCLCAHSVSDRALCRRPSSCQTPSPQSCAPCSRGCCSETSTGGWAAWGTGESRRAPGRYPGPGRKAGREGGCAGAAPPPQGCSREPAALTPSRSPGLRR